MPNQVLATATSVEASATTRNLEKENFMAGRWFSKCMDEERVEKRESLKLEM